MTINSILNSIFILKYILKYQFSSVVHISEFRTINPNFEFDVNILQSIQSVYRK